MQIINRLKISVLLLIITVAFTQCNLKSSTNTTDEIWIGAYQDYAVKFPASLILDFSVPDTLVRLETLEIDTTFNSYKIEGDSIIINDTIKFLFQKSEDEMIFGEPNRGARFYYPPQKTKRLKGSFPNLQTTLKAKTWERTIEKEYESLVIKEQFKFSEDKVVKTRNYFLRSKLVFTEKEQFCYHMLEYKSVVMLLMYGNSETCEATQNLYVSQVIQLDNNNLELYSGISDFEPTIALESTTKPISEAANSFYTCNGNRILQYYNRSKDGNTGSYFPNGNAAILENYNPIKQENNIWKDENGYIRIRFVINCEGETGRWSIQECDRDYNPHVFPNEMVESLLEHTIALKGWVPREPILGRDYDDSKYLTYKIKDGKVVEVFP